MTSDLIDHFALEPVTREGDRRDLQPLLGAKVGEKPALTHAEIVRETPDREAFKAFGNCDPRSPVENDGARALAARVLALPRISGVVDGGSHTLMIARTFVPPEMGPGSPHGPRNRVPQQRHVRVRLPARA